MPPHRKLSLCRHYENFNTAPIIGLSIILLGVVGNGKFFCFCEVADSLSQTFDILIDWLESVLKLSSHFAKWVCAVVITITLRYYSEEYWMFAEFTVSIRETVTTWEFIISLVPRCLKIPSLLKWWISSGSVILLVPLSARCLIRIFLVSSAYETCKCSIGLFSLLVISKVYYQGNH